MLFWRELMAEEAAVLEQGTIAPAPDNIEVGSETPSETVETAAPAEVEPEAPTEAVETATPPSLDDLDEDTLVAHPKIKDLLARREKSASDRALAEQERRQKAEAGQEAHVQNITAVALKEAIEAATGEPFDPRSLPQGTYEKFLNATAVAIRANREIELGNVVTAIQQWFAGQEIAPDDRVSLENVRQEKGERSMEYMDALRSVAVKYGIGAVKLADVPEGSQLHKDIAAHMLTERSAIEKMVRAELAPKGPIIPNMPKGKDASGKVGPTPTEYASASPEQRAKWRAEGVEVAI